MSKNKNKGGDDRNRLDDLELALNEREEEAKTLDQAGFRSTAAALRVYALEIRLKVMVCRRLNLLTLPKACITHDLSEVLVYTGLSQELQVSEDASLAAVRQNWDILDRFSRNRLNDQRYLPRNNLAQDDYEDINRALDEAEFGVLTWLSKPR